MPPDPDLVEELALVERARHGDHDAFVRLYRQDAPAAWRLALALTADADRAAPAVAEGFRRTLAPSRGSGPRSETPFHLRLLAATRHAVIDGAGVGARPVPAPASDLRTAPPAAVRVAQVMAAFHQLPERTRSILWLVAVEGLGTLEASRVLALRPTHAEELTDRATAALREQWRLDRAAAGDDTTVAPDDLADRLQPVLPLPMELFAAAEASWAASRAQPAGPLRLVLPGGRPVPRWAERTLVGATGALIAIGITSALAIDRDPTSRDRRPSRTASADSSPALDDPAPLAGAAPDGGGAVADAAGSTTTLARRIAAASDDVVAAAAAPATAAGDVPSTEPTSSTAPTTPTTAPSPLLQATVGLGPTLGVAVGDCTGLELAGTVAGCPPPTKPSGLTLDLSGTLLGG